MADDRLMMGRIVFTAPVLEGLVIDSWIGRIQLLVGEIAAPYSEQRPRRYRITYDDVVESRCYRPRPAVRFEWWLADVPFQLEEIDAAGERDASNELGVCLSCDESSVAPT